MVFERKGREDQVDTTNTVEDRKIRSSKLGAVGDFRDAGLGGGLNSYSLTWTKGKLTLDQPGLLAADQAPATGLQTAGDFNQTKADFRRLQRISDSVALELPLIIQASGR